MGVEPAVAAELVAAAGEGMLGAAEDRKKAAVED